MRRGKKINVAIITDHASRGFHYHHPSAGKGGGDAGLIRKIGQRGGGAGIAGDDRVLGGSIMLNQYSITRARCRMAKSTVEIGGTALLLLGSDSLHLVAGRNPNRLRQSLIKNRKVLMGEIGVKKITHYEGHPCTRSNKSAHHLITFITLIKLVNHIKQKRRKKVYRTNASQKEGSSAHQGFHSRAIKRTRPRNKLLIRFRSG